MRYPDAMADPAVPFESYTRAQAAEAVQFAQQIAEFVERQVG